jgi:hypothetical protein
VQICLRDIARVVAAMGRIAAKFLNQQEKKFLE